MLNKLFNIHDPLQKEENSTVNYCELEVPEQSFQPGTVFKREFNYKEVEAQQPEFEECLKVSLALHESSYELLKKYHDFMRQYQAGDGWWGAEAQIEINRVIVNAKSLRQNILNDYLDHPTFYHLQEDLKQTFIAVSKTLDIIEHHQSLGDAFNGYRWATSNNNRSVIIEGQSRLELLITALIKG